VLRFQWTIVNHKLDVHGVCDRVEIRCAKRGLELLMLNKSSK